MALSAPASAKLGTGDPKIWLGYKMSYGAELLVLRQCQTNDETSCAEPLKQALQAVKDWNHCLDDLLLSHHINLLWPDFPEDRVFVDRMHFRAQLAEDLLAQGGYTNLVIETCLPGQTIVIP